jgi:hypothetical protein
VAVSFDTHGGIAMRIDVSALPVPSSIEDAYRRRTELMGKIQLIQAELGDYSERRDADEVIDLESRAWRKRAKGALAFANAELRVVKDYIHQNASKVKTTPPTSPVTTLAESTDLTTLARLVRDYTKAYSHKVYVMEQELIRLRAENDQLRAERCDRNG